MAFPTTPLTTKVELALGADLTADPSSWTWTDITSQVLHRDRIQVTRGRSNEQGQLEPSRASLTLKNTNGQFVPRNPNSPYYGQLRKNTPIRIQVNPGSGLVTRFTGFVSEWPPRWDTSGKDKYVQIQANGITRRLGQGATPLKSALYRAHHNADPLPTAYWPLEDGSDAQQVASGLLSGVPLGITGSPVLGSDQRPAGSASSIAFDNGDALRGIVDSAKNNTWTVSAWIRGAVDPLAPSLPIRWTTPRGTLIRTWELSISNEFDSLDFSGYADDGAAFLIMSAPLNLILGEWHHVIIMAVQNAGNIDLTMRVDGVVVDTATRTSETNTEITSIAIGNGQVGTTLAGQVCHLAVWNVPTNKFLVWDPIFQAGLGYAGETASSRGGK